MIGWVSIPMYGSILFDFQKPFGISIVMIFEEKWFWISANNPPVRHDPSLKLVAIFTRLHSGTSRFLVRSWRIGICDMWIDFSNSFILFSIRQTNSSSLGVRSSALVHSRHFERMFLWWQILIRQLSSMCLNHCCRSLMIFPTYEDKCSFIN